MGRKSITITTILILFQALQLSAQTNTDFWITESIVKARAPKRLRTFAPFWGVPEPMSGQKQTPLSSDTFMYARIDSTSIPEWACWNLDLLSSGDSRYKAEKLIPESSTRMLSLGYSSIAFLIPSTAGPTDNIYSYSESVNIVEMKSGYNLFPKLPASVQELVEEMTTYELFCPFQEVEEGLREMLEVEFENGSEGVEQSVE